MKTKDLTILEIIKGLDNINYKFFKLRQFAHLIIKNPDKAEIIAKEMDIQELLNELDN